ncbi:hypothetical protein B0H16DRAFT_1737695 [Mycena metata]|uniref:Uncharacterized protein n=1 Tax=Mycena metata TaxID=1033252 RepID=A0AAD7HK03_9AGAR|nr:hypothetical protein B0H16DRAFT_1737695 [Mycena metata]
MLGNGGWHADASCLYTTTISPALPSVCRMATYCLQVRDVEGFVAGKQDTPSTQATVKTGRSVNLPAAACHRRPGGKAPTLQDPMAYRRASFHSESGVLIMRRFASCGLL